ncbi:MAG: hypothetical protein VB861_20555 [Planctomycetaceae bacterium]
MDPGYLLLTPDDIERLLKAVADVSDTMQFYTSSSAANSLARPNR